MTLSEADRKWREERTAPAPARKAARADGRRFAPLNALVDGGWLGTLTHREVKVWMVLYRHAGPGGLVRASHGTIAAKAGMRREDAARTTKRLERHGLLVVRVRGRTVGSAGKRTANEYEVRVPACTNSGDGATIGEDE